MPLHWLAALEWSKVTEKLPPQFLQKTGVFLLAVVAIVIVVKIIQGSNKILLSIVLAAAMGIVFFSWIYNRNEPEFLTPIIEPLAQFFPSKGYEKRDLSDPTGQSKGSNKPREPRK